MKRILTLALCLFAAAALADNNSQGCQGNCSTGGTPTPSTFNIDPVVSPTIVGPSTTVAPVVAPLIAPVIAPRVDSNNTNLNANSVKTDVGVGVVVAPDQRNANSVTVAPVISPRQEQTQGQTQGQTQSQTATATSNQTQAVNNGQTIAPAQSMTYNEAAPPADTKATIRYAPQVNAPALASAINNDLCVVSASVGGSGIGFGIGIGLQFRDEDCVRRVNARQLFNFGFGRAALLLMAQDPAVKQALDDAGVDLKGLTMPEQPKAQVTTYTR